MNEKQTLKKTILVYILFICLPLSNFGQEKIEYGNNNKVGKFIKVNDIKMYYEVYGEGQPLLLIHGNKTGIKGWKPQIDFFSKKYKVFAVDCRGRGKSELGKDSLSYIQIANDLNQFVNLMKIDSVNILGKSDGGIVGILMGIYYPKKISKIVAFGSNMKSDTTALYKATLEEIKTERRFADQMIAKGDTSQNWKIEQQRNRMMEFQPNISAEELNKINVPVLVMSCDRDVIKIEHTLFIYNNIKFSNLSIFPGELHRVTRENPDLFNETVDNFISKPFVTNSERFK